jgi:hypothetical protein
MATYTKQRSNDRLKIPGAVVYPCLKVNRWSFFLGSIKASELYNINKSGICFESGKLYRKGESVCVMVKIPGEKRFYVEANIKWIEDKPKSSGYYIGAQLQPFGKGRKFNSYKTLHRLRELHKKYDETLYTAMAHS